MCLTLHLQVSKVVIPDRSICLDRYSIGGAKFLHLALAASTAISRKSPRLCNGIGSVPFRKSRFHDYSFCVRAPANETHCARSHRVERGWYFNSQPMVMKMYVHGKSHLDFGDQTPDVDKKTAIAMALESYEECAAVDDALRSAGVIVKTPHDDLSLQYSLGGSTTDKVDAANLVIRVVQKTLDDGTAGQSIVPPISRLGWQGLWRQVITRWPLRRNAQPDKTS